MYYNLKQGLDGFPNMKEITSPIKIENPNKDYYRSVYDYTKEAAEKIRSSGSYANVTDVNTNRVLWDFDYEKAPTLAKDHALELVHRLINKGINQDAINVYFSGNKGFHVEFDITQRITPEQHKVYVTDLAKDLSTFDPSIYHTAALIRVENTKNEKTGLFKIPLTLGELQNYSIDQIRTLATVPRTGMSRRSYPQAVHIPPVKPSKTPQVASTSTTEVEAARKPKWLSNCKYALQNGMFGEGMRSRALHCLAATYKGQGFSREHVKSILLTTIELAVERGAEPFDEAELDKNILSQVFSPTHQGGTYTCKEPGWLQDYCKGLGELSCKHEELDEVVKVTGIFDKFTDYVNNLDKNILKTGIDRLDKAAMFLMGTSNFIIGAPSSGKTSLLFQLLNYNSNNNIPSLFFSYDVYHSGIFMRLLQRHTGLTQRQVYDIWKNNPNEATRLKELVEKEYKNVSFCFKTGQTLDDFEKTIIETEKSTGSKLKLVLVDYNALLIAKSSDPTQASAEIANRLRQIANEREVCIITLVQPTKNLANPSNEMTSYSAGKGSGMLAESATIVLGISRPGFDPHNQHLDKFMNIAILKNRNGALGSFDYIWDGVTGTISEIIDEEDYNDLKYLREKKKMESQDGHF